MNGSLNRSDDLPFFLAGPLLTPQIVEDHPYLLPAAHVDVLGHHLGSGLKVRGSLCFLCRSEQVFGKIPRIAFVILFGVLFFRPAPAGCF